jgi:membrane-bound lytic murein transglycosylase F
MAIFMFKKANLAVLGLLIALLFSACHNPLSHDGDGHDYEAIIKSGKLRAVTDYNSTSYFVYRGTPIGYQYDLLKRMAADMGLELELTVVNDMETSFEKLNRYECDLLAINLTITGERKHQVAFTDPILQTTQVLVQKKPDNWAQMSAFNIERHLIRVQTDLAGKTVHVPKNSAFAHRLRHLCDEIGDTIYIEEVENYDTEQLIVLVAKGEIDYTVADENLAQLNQSFYPELDISMPVSFVQNQAWAVNLNNSGLKAEINQWLAKNRNTNFMLLAYNRYYKDMRFAGRGTSDYSSISGGKISDYDYLIKKYSAQIDWDWRLLASLIYQESKFNHNSISWAGAFGLMQLMPLTAMQFGITESSSAEENILAGTKYIAWLNKQFSDSVSNPDERIKFILASYNVGIGHVMDARRLAAANAKDPNIWTDNVDYFLLNKSNPKYFDRQLVKYGNIKGVETYRYVKEITERYEIYKKLIR